MNTLTEYTHLYDSDFTLIKIIYLVSYILHKALYMTSNTTVVLELYLA